MRLMAVIAMRKGTGFLRVVRHVPVRRNRFTRGCDEFGCALAQLVKRPVAFQADIRPIARGLMKARYRADRHGSHAVPTCPRAGHSEKHEHTHQVEPMNHFGFPLISTAAGAGAMRGTGFRCSPEWRFGAREKLIQGPDRNHALSSLQMENTRTLPAWLARLARWRSSPGEFSFQIV